MKRFQHSSMVKAGRLARPSEFLLGALAGHLPSRRPVVRVNRRVFDEIKRIVETSRSARIILQHLSVR